MVSKDVEKYVNVDADIQTYNELSDKQIINTVINPELDETADPTEGSNTENTQEKDEAENDTEVKLADVYKTLRTMRYYGLKSCPDIEEFTDKIETALNKNSVKSLKQRKLTDLWPSE